MISSTSPQYQDLFQACLGFASQLSKSPGLNCRLEVKLGDKSFNFQTGSTGKVPGKKKCPSDYKRVQRRRKPPRKGMPTSGNYGVGSVSPVDSTGAQNKKIFFPALSSPPCSRTVPWSRHVFSPTDIPQLDGAGSFMCDKGLGIRASAPLLRP